MNFIRSSRAACLAALACCAAGWMPAAGAQPMGAATTGAAAPRQHPSEAPIGTDTRHLLAIQRDGSQAGAALPMPGEQAALAHARYLKSFQHPIPERFVGQSGNGAGVGLGIGSSR